jgi:hypothetical protein
MVADQACRPAIGKPAVVVPSVRIGIPALNPHALTITARTEKSIQPERTWATANATLITDTASATKDNTDDVRSTR